MIQDLSTPTKQCVERKAEVDVTRSCSVQVLIEKWCVCVCVGDTIGSSTKKKSQSGLNPGDLKVRGHVS